MSSKAVLLFSSASPTTAVRCLLQRDDCLSLPHLHTQCARALSLALVREVRGARVLGLKVPLLPPHPLFFPLPAHTPTPFPACSPPPLSLPTPCPP